MKRAIILAAAMAIAACHSRNEEQVGAAPDADTDEPATHVIDTARTGPPGTGGRPSDATVTVDSVIDDTANVVADTTYEATSPSPISTPQDTLGPGDPDTGMHADTTSGGGWTGTGTDTIETMPADTGGYR